MNNQGVFLMVMKILGIVVLIDLTLIGLVLLFGWWAGWQTEGEFKSAILIAGILVTGIGFLGIKGNWDVLHSFKNLGSLPTTRRSSLERTQQKLTDFTQRYSFMIIMFLSGSLCLIIGLLP